MDNNEKMSKIIELAGNDMVMINAHIDMNNGVISPKNGNVLICSHNVVNFLIKKETMEGERHGYF